MNVEGLHENLLRGLAPGAVMWIRASGRSLWPLLRDGDSLKIERIAGAPQLGEIQLGEIVVVKLPSGVLAAHLVASLDPLQTASSVGILDPLPVEALGRVIGFRRSGAVHDWPGVSRHLMRWLPATARALKRVPLLRHLLRQVVRRVRGS